MKTRVSIALAAAALAAAATAAHADDRKRELTYVGNAIGQFAGWIDDLQHGKRGTMSDPKECYDYVATYTSEGVKGNEQMRASEFGRFPGKAGGAVKDPDSTYWLLPFSRANQICETYAKMREAQKIVAGLDQYGAERLGMKPEEFVDLGGNGDFTAHVEHGRQCLRDVDAALAAGVPPEFPVHETTLAEFRVKRCQRIIDHAEELNREVPKLKKAERDGLIAIYKKAGMKGARLELFVESGHPDNSGWLGSGCDKFITDPKKMAKAKKLFTWSEGSDGYTVTKYTFKKDKYTLATRSFSTQEAAYRWCR